MSPKYVVSYSGGVSSWCATRRLLDGGVAPDEVVLLFADTHYESPGLYRFLEQSVEQLGCRLVTISDGRTPCSRLLKREPLDHWTRENAPDAVRVVGVRGSCQKRRMEGRMTLLIIAQLIVTAGLTLAVAITVEWWWRRCKEKNS